MPNINDLLSQQQNPNTMGSMPPTAPMPTPPGAPGTDAATPPMPMPGGPMPGGMPPAPDTGSAPASPDQRAELDRLFQNVQMGNSKLVSDNLMSRNQVSLMRKEMIGKMFELLQQAGVDPANPASVRSFLQQLEQTDPDLLQMFQDAFASLAGGDVAGAGQAPDSSQSPPDPNLMPGSPGATGGDLTSRFRNLQGMPPQQ